MAARKHVVIGQTYALLTVIKEHTARAHNNELTYVCQCACGNPTNATRSQLLLGGKKSCGCLRRRTPANAINLSGKRFGKLEAIERDGTNDKGQALWRCKCDCGNYRSFTATILRRGEATSCGCSQGEQLQRAHEALFIDRSVDGVTIPLLTKKVRSDSGTGHKGVHRRERRGKVYYEAYITVKGKRMWGPSRASLTEAIADRRRLEEQYHKPYLEGYHGQTTDQSVDY